MVLPSTAEASQGAPGAIEHPRVLWIKNPSREAVISWTTRQPGEKHRIYYDTEAHGTKISAYRNQAETFKDGMYTMLEVDHRFVEPGYYHHVYLKDLTPGTRYHILIESDGRVSRQLNFITALENDMPFQMLFGGDSRIEGKTPYEHTDRRKMNDRVRMLFEENPRVLALLHGGDYCERAEWRYLDAWLTDQDRVITRDGRMLPIIPVRGNHDVQIGFEEMFPWPEMKRSYYYTTQLSSQMALVTLNTEISMGGDQRDWLRDTLPGLREANRWLIASYHRPAYPSVRNMQDGESRRRNFVPHFEANNIDLACESHDHALKRTVPIRDGKHDPDNGIIYIGDGGLGVPQRTPDPSRWWFQGDDSVAKSAHHVHLFDFGEQEFRARAFGMAGEVLDDFTLRPKRRG
ncbi:MAG: fibronectin type III domain-containing protein [Luteolibacter sp.]